MAHVPVAVASFGSFFSFQLVSTLTMLLLIFHAHRTMHVASQLLHFTFHNQLHFHNCMVIHVAISIHYLQLLHSLLSAHRLSLSAALPPFSALGFGLLSSSHCHLLCQFPATAQPLLGPCLTARALYHQQPLLTTSQPLFQLSFPCCLVFLATAFCNIFFYQPSPSHAAILLPCSQQLLVLSIMAHVLHPFVSASAFFYQLNPSQLLPLVSSALCHQLVSLQLTIKHTAI